MEVFAFHCEREILTPFTFKRLLFTSKDNLKVSKSTVVVLKATNISRRKRSSIKYFRVTVLTQN